MAYSREDEAVVPVVTAVEEQVIPLVWADLLFNKPLFLNWWKVLVYPWWVNFGFPLVEVTNSMGPLVMT